MCRTVNAKSTSYVRGKKIFLISLQHEDLKMNRDGENTETQKQHANMSSAFLAIQNNEEIFYDRNSSDEELSSDNEVELAPVPITTSLREPSAGVGISSSSMTISSATPTSYKEPVYSKFNISHENTVFRDLEVYVGLTSNESLVIKGHYELCILKGALLIDGVRYEASKGSTNSSSKLMMVFAPVTHSLPELKVVEGKGNNGRNGTFGKLTEQIFGADICNKFSTIIKLRNGTSKIETIGSLCPTFKNVFHNNLYNQLSSDEGNFVAESIINENNYNNDRQPIDLNFKDYTFCIILKPTLDLNVVDIPVNWQQTVDTLVYKNYETTSKKILIIGYKNSGKSTLLKYLVNSYLSQSNYIDPVGILDIDPGQNEFSWPNCLSYTAHRAPIIGNDLAAQQHEYSYASNEYFGFNNSMENPGYYLQLIEKLYKEYQRGDYLRQVPLIVNTPGWVKGYGVELVSQIIKIIKPTDVIYLGTSKQQYNDYSQDVGEDELLNKILEKKKKYIKNEVIFASGISLSYNSLRFSAQELATFRMLVYFHTIKNQDHNPDHGGAAKQQQQRVRFDFSPLLLKSPFRVSYLDNNQNGKLLDRQFIDNFEGISGVSFINDTELNFDPGEEKNGIAEDIVETLLDCTVVGLYGIEVNELITLHNNGSKIADGDSENNNKHSNNRNSPLFIPFETLKSTDDSAISFLGLAIIHSVNLKQRYFNVYIQPHLLESEIEEVIESHKLLFVRGKAAVPVWEMYPTQVSELILKKNGSSSANTLGKETGSENDIVEKEQEKDKKVTLFKNEKIPFISMNDKFGKGGKILKVRRNIQRRR